MSLHRAVARRLRSWDVEFNLLVVSGVSTHLCQSYRDEEANEFVVVDGETPSIDVRVAIGRNQNTTSTEELGYQNHPMIKYPTHNRTRNRPYSWWMWK